MAQAGLNGPKTRQQLDPRIRDAYLELIKGADVSRLDRGESKSVRVVFDVTPKILAAATLAVPAAPTPAATPTVPAHKRRAQKLAHQE
jgi:5-deoxy-D-glucuronate isomerase